MNSRVKSKISRQRVAAPFEKEIQESILAYLSLNGIFAWPNKTQGTFDAKRGVFRKPTSRYWRNGIPDILGFTSSGRFFAIEVKRPKTGKISDDQRQFIAQAAARNCIVFIATSIDDVRERIEELKK